MANELHGDIKSKKDKIIYWPIFIPIVVLLLSIYEPLTGFLTLFLIFFPLTMIVLGTLFLFKKMFLKSLSVIFCAFILWLFVFDQTVVNFITSERIYLNFLLNEKYYEKDINTLSGVSGLRFKEWILPDSTPNLDRRVVYDESDSVPKNDGYDQYHACKKSSLKVEGHFYVVDDWCP